MLVRFTIFVLPLGFDTLAVALALGLRGLRPLRPALVFAAFETLMPVAGIVIGRFVGARYATAAAVLGGLVLLAVGAFALREAFENEDENVRLAFNSWPAAAAAGLGVSLDELAVGFPLGAAQLPVAALLIALGTQAFAVTFAGILIGRRARASLGRSAVRTAGVCAGVAFCALGVWLIARAFTAVHALGS